MIWKQIYGLVAVAVISCSTAMALVADSVTATIGEPYILKFGYGGPTHGVNFHFSKDGKPFLAEKIRVFLLLRRLSFIEISESDAGVYTLEVNGKGISYKKSITLLGS